MGYSLFEIAGRNGRLAAKSGNYSVPPGFGADARVPENALANHLFAPNILNLLNKEIIGLRIFSAISWR
jgi:hypothetical protein